MTIICALNEPGVGTWIGSDTMATRDSLCRFDRGSKWTIGVGAAMASAGTHITTNVIQAHSEELLSGDVPPFELAQRLRKLQIDYGFTTRPDEGKVPWLQAWIIYATPLGVWHLTTDGGAYSIGAGHLCADGSGEQFAYGAAHATQSSGAEAQVSAALAAAIALDDGCGGEQWAHLLKASA